MVNCFNTETSTYFTHDVWGEVFYDKCPGDIPYHTYISTFNNGNVTSNDSYPRNNTRGTNGLWSATGREHSVAAGPDSDYVKVDEYVIDTSMRLVMSKMLVDPANHGDYLTIKTILPSAYTGKITADVSSGTTLNLVAKALTTILPGMYLTLSEGSTVQDLGKVTAVNKQTLQVTVTETVANSFTTAADVIVTYVQIQDLKLLSGIDYTMGAHANSNLYIPAGSTVQIFYKNMSASAKTISYFMETFT